MIKILDLSNHHPPNTVNYAKIAEQIQGVILRAVYGTSKDKSFDTHYQNFRAEGLPIGAYHYLVEYKSPEEQIGAMIRAIADKQLELTCWADVELEKDQQPLTRRTVDKYIEGVEPILGDFGIYSSRHYWDMIMRTDKYKDRLFWVANYYASFPAMPVTGGWDHWWMWQYTPKGKLEGILGSVDLNYFGSTVEDYIDWSGIEIDLPEDIPMYKVEVLNCYYLNVRSGPGIQHAILRQLANGDQVIVYQEYQGWLKIDGGWISAAYTIKVEDLIPEPVEYGLEEKVEMLWTAHPELH